MSNPSSRAEYGTQKEQRQQCEFTEPLNQPSSTININDTQLMSKRIHSLYAPKPDQASAATASPAVEAVFDTTELLEMILLHLPLRTLLLASRTSPRFRDVIKGSKKIEKALWLRPTDIAPLSFDGLSFEANGWWMKDGRFIHPIVNPFFTITLPSQPAVPSFGSLRFFSPIPNIYFGCGETIGFSGSNSHPFRHFTVKLAPTWSSTSAGLLHIQTRLNNTRATFKWMPMSFPPIKDISLHYRHLDAKGYVARDPEKALSIGDLISAAIMHMQTGVTSDWPVVQRGDELRLLGRTVDEITGWEILEVFDEHSGLQKGHAA